MKTAIILVVAILYGVESADNVTDEEKLYTFNAAVIEYKPIRNSSLSAEDVTNLNTAEYLDLLANVTQDLDLILFPESTLTSGTSQASVVPAPFTEIICNSTDTTYQDYLKRLSCAAIDYNTTVVINIVEKENCTLNNATGFCPSSGIVYYNSDVAFNETGAVSGRYRKWNLFGEYPLSPPRAVELTTITTKNNVSFGIFTCFDILFNQPALNLTRDLRLKNILFPSMWFSELPFLTALQVQQMWAEENDVNLLSAGANNPAVGSGGTGIFTGGQGPSDYEIISGTGGARIITRSIPRLEIENNPFREFQPIEEDVDELAKGMDSFYLKVDASVYEYNGVVLNTSKTTIVEEVCHGDTIKLCCEFRVTIAVDQNISDTANQYVYHLVAFDGVRSFDGTRDGGIEACGLVACLNESIASCGQRFSNYSEIVWPITFQNISIIGTFVKDENRIQFPNSLLSSIRPLSPQYTTWESEEVNGNVKRTLAITRPQVRLLTFGIYGRDFNRDSPVKVPSGNRSAELPSINALVFAAILYLCLRD